MFHYFVPVDTPPAQRHKIRSLNQREGSQYRQDDVGENIAWDLTENGHPCAESVYRWYAEIFYFNPKKATKGRRDKDPVGHLTALLWPDTTEVGCATVTTPIKQPPNTVPNVLLSTYTVCHYTPQGNILGQIGDKWSSRRKEYCSTYNNWNGANKCVNGRFSNCQVYKTFSSLNPHANGLSL